MWEAPRSRVFPGRLLWRDREAPDGQAGLGLSCLLAQTAVHICYPVIRGAAEWLGSWRGWDLLAVEPLGTWSTWGGRPHPVPGVVAFPVTALPWVGAAGGSSPGGRQREDDRQRRLELSGQGRGLGGPWCGKNPGDSSLGHLSPPLSSSRLLWQIVLTLKHPLWTKH